MAIENSDEIFRAKAEYMALPREPKWKYGENKDNARLAWSNLCMPVIEKAKTIAEAKEAFKISPWGSPAKLRALEKWAELCTTLAELQDAMRASSRRFYHTENPVFQKWDAITCVEAHTASTFDEAVQAVLSSPRGYYEGEGYRRAVEKLFGLCQTPDDPYRAFCRIGSPSYGFEWNLYRSRVEEIYKAQTGENFVWPARPY